MTYKDAGISFHIRTEDEKQTITTQKKTISRISIFIKENKKY